MKQGIWGESDVVCVKLRRNGTTSFAVLHAEHRHHVLVMVSLALAPKGWVKQSR